MNKLPITIVQPGDVVYVDISTFSEAWYQDLGLPDPFHVRYIMEWRITGWKKNPTSLYAYSPLYNQYYIVKQDGALNWCRWKDINDSMVLLTAEHLVTYPLLRSG